MEENKKPEITPEAIEELKPNQLPKKSFSSGSGGSELSS